MICQVCKQDHTDKNMRWCDRSDLQIENDYLRAENARYREALQSYADLADGEWYGPDDKYYNIGDTAREALKGRE